MIIGGWRKPALPEVARWVDGRQHLKERLSTALEVAADPDGGTWRDLVVTDAAEHVKGLDLRRLVPFRLPRATRWALVVLALGAGLGLRARIPQQELSAKEGRPAEHQGGRPPACRLDPPQPGAASAGPRTDAEGAGERHRFGRPACEEDLYAQRGAEGPGQRGGEAQGRAEGDGQRPGVEERWSRRRGLRPGTTRRPRRACRSKSSRCKSSWARRPAIPTRWTS